ncbi:hypothetical protein CSOJ01_11401 [Colletotrichum sojae]|uniref:Uncharacterized protein n=1 Tax=Colletotrichum sojae TaxID=2175907 RepID=A0A8H6MNR6_9PEZI|nr:hypothetical protein CSOJ01_11401 [Colletotrichum sojae]
MSSNANQNTSHYTSIPRQHQGQTPSQYTYQQPGGSAALNSWLSEPDSSAAWHNAGAYRPFRSGGGGANAWGTAPSSNGATRGSGQGR